MMRLILKHFHMTLCHHITFAESDDVEPEVVVMETIGDWAANEFMATWHRNSAIIGDPQLSRNVTQPRVALGQHLP